jgi:acylphosphatase
MLRKQVTFTGRVQGVGFRFTAQAIARGRDISGWVKNQPDGTVLLELQGSLEAVGDYLAALRKAMGRNIQGESAIDVPPDTGEQGFEIRR